MSPRAYTSTVRADSAAATRRAVLAAALEIFQERGYAGTTVAEIARKAGVALNTVRVSVGSKPQLLLALVDEAATDDAIVAAMDHVHRADSVEEVIASLSEGTRKVFERHGWLLTSLYAHAAADPLLSAYVQTTEVGYRARMMEAAARIAELVPSLTEPDVQRVADVLWFYFGVRPWRELTDAKWAWDQIGEWLSSQARYGLELALNNRPELDSA